MKFGPFGIGSDVSHIENSYSPKLTDSVEQGRRLTFSEWNPNSDGAKYYLRRVGPSKFSACSMCRIYEEKYWV